MERLLDEPEYGVAFRWRGRMSIQSGFSDSGRFTGADRGRSRHRAHSCADLARVGGAGHHAMSMSRSSIRTVSRWGAARFGTIEERLDHLPTPWSRGRFARDGLRLQAEVSFQGGDGYMHFQTQKLADAAIASLLTWSFAPTAKPKDCFYDDINFFVGRLSRREGLAGSAVRGSALSGGVGIVRSELVAGNGIAEHAARARVKG